MEAKYEARKQELLDECTVAPQIFERVMPRLERFMERFVENQGHRIKILAKQEIFEETGVPGGFFSLLLQTGFRSVTLQQRGDKATYEAHVLGSMTVADATAVFAKHDIHHPV
jgi:hypothetical protein